MKFYYNNPVGIKKNDRLNCECGIRDWVVLVFFVEINNFNLIDLTLFFCALSFSLENRQSKFSEY